MKARIEQVAGGGGMMRSPETLVRPCFHTGTRPPPDPAMALVVGGARCVWRDLQSLEEMLGGPWPGLVVAVNDVPVHLPYLDMWVTRHPEKLRRDSQHIANWGWERQRAEEGLPAEYETYSPKRPITDHFADTAGLNGASGFLGAYVASCKTREASETPRVVLAGVPMTAQPHFEESRVHVRGRNWHPESHWRCWTSDRGRRLLGHHVRSMSGRTAELLGTPTPEWIRGDE